MTLAVGFAAAALVSFASAAPAAPPSLQTLLGERLSDGRRPGWPVIGRYETDEGGGFVFDLSMPAPLLKFEDSPEIWVLHPTPGPRGDTIYRNDLGEIMLRADRSGGMTVFTATRPEGSAAALQGGSRPLRLGTVTPAALFSRVYQASVRASRAAQHQVGFEARYDAQPATAAALADTAQVVSQALAGIAERAGGKAVLARINDVLIAPGDHPSADLKRGVLTITIVPAQGVAGRPSSRRIELAAGLR